MLHEWLVAIRNPGIINRSSIVMDIWEKDGVPDQMIHK